jgi:tetratricopeptide (TPR) repeat protein
VDKEKIVNILKDPQQVTSEDLLTLEKWLNHYPYFQSAHILIAKLANDNNSPNKEIKLNYAAIYSPNRGVLKRIVLNPISDIPQMNTEQSVENISSDQSETSTELSQEYPQFQEAISDDWKQKNENYNQKLKDEYLIRKESFEIKEEEETEDEMPVPKVNQKLVDEVLANLERARQLKKEYLEQEEVDDTKEADDQVKHQEDVKDDHDKRIQEPEMDEKSDETDNISAPPQKDLIDRFIENERTMGKIQPRLNVEPQVDLAEKSTSLSDDMVSENLASILQKQGKKEKAIDIYKKLIWKFPQKRAYFASLIEELKNN